MTSERHEASNDRAPRPGILSIPWHPLLFGLYPALALLAANIGQVRPSEGLRVALGSAIAAAIVFLAAFLVARRAATAALLATVTMLFLLSYGHLYDGLKLAGVSGAVLVRHRYLVPLFLGGWIVALALIRRKEVGSRTTGALNLMAAVAIALPLARLAVAQVEAGRFQAASGAAEECTLRPGPDSKLRDVYLIVMDAYERDDILWEMHGYDNSPFLEALEARGFTVARGSLSNYRHTELSLASVLNMEYVENLAGYASPQDIDRWRIIQSIRSNRVRHELECLGYLTVATETGAFWTEWEDADYYLERGSGPLRDLRLVGGISRFEEEFLGTTIVRAVIDGARINARARIAGAGTAGMYSRDLIDFELKQLEAVAGLPAPKVVFVHVLSPHPPFLFGPNGEEVDLGEFETGRDAVASGEAILKAYADQVTYLNGRLLRAVDAILANSNTPPVIVIMGDHGWADRNAEDKLSILNAYYLPGEEPTPIWPTITPVNTFRIIFDSYFGGAFGRLEDRSYTSDESDIFNFQEVPNTWETRR